MAAEVKCTDANFIEVSMPCTDVELQEAFWVDLFDAKVIFRGRMNGQRFSRIIVAGVSLVFREDADFQPPPGPEQEFEFRRHLGLRVPDMDVAIQVLRDRGAHFVLTPDDVRRLQNLGGEEGQPLLEVDYIASPLTAARIARGEFKHEVAILVAPDNVWVELNEIRQPPDVRWYSSLPPDWVASECQS